MQVLLFPLLLEEIILIRFACHVIMKSARLSFRQQFIRDDVLTFKHDTTAMESLFWQKTM